MNAQQKNRELRRRFECRNINLDLSDCNLLRRAELTLQKWGEGECGDGNDYCSWSIERDEQTGKPYMVYYPHSGPSRRYAIPDREKGALKRIATLCKAKGLHYYHQTDPRGCSLYVDKEPIPENNYTRAVSCSV